MPGSGKSYFGRKLSEALNITLVDLDSAIEQKENRTISEIFAADGEAYFREVENSFLKEISVQHEEIIVSTGGGTPCFLDGLDFMIQNGVTVFLEADKELLIERLISKSHRPLVQGDTEKRVEDLLKNRLPIYERAQISIAHREVDLLLDEIKSLKS